MKNYLTAIFILAIAINLSAQEWQTNFDDAKALASKENKAIVLVFQGSDWCAPCIKLDKQVWSTDTFQKLAKDKFVMLKADFPRRKANKLSKELQEQNNSLAEQYNAQGFFPLAVVLNKDGKSLGKIGYEKIEPSAYFKKLTAFTN